MSDLPFNWCQVAPPVPAPPETLVPTRYGRVEVQALDRDRVIVRLLGLRISSSTLTGYAYFDRDNGWVLGELEARRALKDTAVSNRATDHQERLLRAELSAAIGPFLATLSEADLAAARRFLLTTRHGYLGTDLRWRYGEFAKKRAQVQALYDELRAAEAELGLPATPVPPGLDEPAEDRS